MQLTPRYDGPPILVIEPPAQPPVVAVARQRRRLVELLESLTDEQWAHASRCEGWSVQDVISHLVTVDGFWQLSVGQGAAGAPTRFLAEFDPAATPPLLVEPLRALSPAEVLHRFRDACAGFLSALEGLDDAGWDALAESPAGHVPIRLMSDHALWDCWIHERDIALPLGLTPVVEADEVSACLRYAAALSPGFAISTGNDVAGTYAVRATTPDGGTDEFVLDVSATTVSVRDGATADPDAPVLEGDAVDLVEALSIRAPLPDGTPAEWHRILGGLATVFDAPS